MVDDARELAEVLNERHGKTPLVVGHSWGSALGVVLASRSPELICGFVGTGQLIEIQENYKRSHAYVVQKLGKKALTVEPPLDNIEEFLQFVPTMAQSGAMLHGLTWEEFGAVVQASPIALEPSEMDGADQMLSFGMLGADLFELDLTNTARFDVPIQLILGRHDYNTPSSLAAEWLEGVSAPAKDLVWLESSAHFPHVEEPAAFAEAIRGWTDTCR
jgi:proline iminopeptidase